MTFDLSRFIFAILESIIIILTIHLVLPRHSRLPIKQNILLFVITLVTTYFILYNNILLIILLYSILMISIILLNRTDTYVASLSLVVVFILTLISSLIATIFAIFFYTKQFDYRFILEGNQYSAMILKAIITGICVYIYKVFNSLFNRKTKIQKINPRPVIFVNVVYVFLIILFSTELIEYIPTIYEDVLKIESLGRLLFTGLLMAYVASIFVLYIINIYLFKSSDYLTIKLSSETDALTSVLNRKAGINFLKERMQNIQLKKGFLTVCFVDVNNLKIVNDEYGHKIGDELIKNTSKIIKSALREGDEIARLGGDEFLIVFDQCSIEQAIRAWDRIIERLESFNLTSKSVYDISVSVGFSEYSHKMDIDHDTLIELADAEMYKNKERYKRLKGKSKHGKW